MNQTDYIETYLNSIDMDFDRGSLSLISDTNNPVYFFSASGQKFIFKLIKDTDIELDFLKTCSDHLMKTVPVQKIVHINHCAEGFARPLVISEYIDGKDVAAVLESGAYPDNFEKHFIDFLFLIANSVNQISPPKKGFGAYKANRTLFKTYEESVDFGIHRYAGKIHRLVPDNNAWLNVYQVMEQCANDVVKVAKPDFCVVALDMNLKNFIWSAKEGLSLINIPITGYSHRAMGFGEILSHLDGAAYTNLWQKIMKAFPDQSGLFSKHVLYAETLGLLGSLSAAIGEDTRKIDSTLCWGYKANIKTKIFNNINKIKGVTANFN